MDCCVFMGQRLDLTGVAEAQKHLSEGTGEGASAGVGTKAAAPLWDDDSRHFQNYGENCASS